MIPLATTTVTISQPDGTGDPYEEATTDPLVSGWRAHIGSPSGFEQQSGGSQERVDAVLQCDPVEGVDHTCTVTDEATDETWTVTWVRLRRGLGLDHMRAGLIAVSGGSNG